VSGEGDGAAGHEAHPWGGATLAVRATVVPSQQPARGQLRDPRAPNRINNVQFLSSNDQAICSFGHVLSSWKKLPLEAGGKRRPDARSSHVPLVSRLALGKRQLSHGMRHQKGGVASYWRAKSTHVHGLSTFLARLYVV
jgi:hypothetical protein